jgi:hypothetical protein
MQNTNKFTIREWLVPPILLPIFCAVGCRRDAYSVVDE